MNPLPSSETLAGYEKLGIVGILLLMLLVLSAMLFQMIRANKGLAKASGQQEKALVSNTEAIDTLADSHARLHARLDVVLACGVPACPVRKLHEVPGEKLTA